MLVEGDHLTIFEIALKSTAGKSFAVVFGALNYCQARLRLPLSALNQNQWRFPREGALLSR